MYYANQLFEGIMLKGYGVSALSLNFLAVVAMAVIFLALAFSTVKDRMDE